MNKKKASLIIVGSIIVIGLIVTASFFLLRQPAEIRREAVVTPDPTRSRYNNPGQGLYQCHTDGQAGSGFAKGGGIIVHWGRLQPNGPNEFDQEALNQLISRIKTPGKRHYLHFELYEQANPGTHNIFPEWLKVTNYHIPPPHNQPYYTEPKEDDDQIEMIYIMNKYEGGKPVYDLYPQPWGEKYQQRLGEFLTQLNQEFEKAGVIDYIEYIEPAAGGVWGTTHLWFNRDDDRHNDLNQFVLAAGCERNDWACLGKKFTQGVNNTFETYMKAFPDLPMMIIGGACKFKECSYAGKSMMIDRFGMRFMYKAAGLGTHQSDCGIRASTFNPICQGANAKTRCGQEPWGDSIQVGGHGFDPNSACGRDYRQVYEWSLSVEPISYYCIYTKDLLFDNSLVGSTNKLIANKLGAQIMLTNVDYNFDTNQTVSGNQDLRITFSWKNDGITTLIAPLKQGEKWAAGSYKLFLEFEDLSGSLVHYHEFDINPPTNSWSPSSQPSNTINFKIHDLGSNLSKGNYKLYAGLTDPNSEHKRFVLTNTANNDPSRGRYFLTNLNLDATPQPTTPVTPTLSATNTPVPSPSPTTPPTLIPTPTSSPVPTATLAPTATPLPTAPPVSPTVTTPVQPTVTGTPVPIRTPLPTVAAAATSTPTPHPAAPTPTASATTQPQATATPISATSPSPISVAVTAPTLPPTLTPTPTTQIVQTVDTTIGCNQPCVSNANCQNISHICHEGACRLDVNPTDELCRTAAGETVVERMAQEPVAGFKEWFSYIRFGLGAIGIGLVLLLLL